MHFMSFIVLFFFFFFFSSRRRHTRLVSDWSSDVCSSDLVVMMVAIFFPSALHRLLQKLAARVARRSEKAAARMTALSAGLDRAHECMVAFGSPKGLATLLLAILISAPSHANKLLAGDLTPRGLGIPAAFFQILVLPNFLNVL